MALNPLYQSGPLDPDTTPQVSAEATLLFVDDFSSSLTTNWVTGGTAPAASAGQVTFASSTTASASSTLTSRAGFPLRIGSYTRPIWHVRHDASAVANTTRYWGLGSTQASPTADLPLVNAVVFELRRADGALYAVTYSAGTRTEVAALTRPTDGAYHRYEIYYRQSRVYWLLDSTTVASIPFANLAIAAGLNLVAGQVNYTTGPSTAPTLQVSAAGVADHSGTVRTLGDGAQPWLAQTVKPASTATAAADFPAVVALHPSSPLPSGSNQIGSVVNASGTLTNLIGRVQLFDGTNAPAVKAAQSSAPAAADNLLSVQPLVPASTYVTATAAAGTAVTVTLPAPASGLRHHVTAFKVTRFAAAALTASATPIVSTASNHSLVVTLPADAATQGSVQKDTVTYYSPLAATTQATATSFTVPATTSVVWRLSVGYYVAP